MKYTFMFRNLRTLPNLIVGEGGLLSRGVGILLQIYRLGGDNK